LSGPIFGPTGIAFVVTIMGSHGDFDLSYDGKPAKALTKILAEASERLTAHPLKPVRRGGEPTEDSIGGRHLKPDRAALTPQ
jgi:hypothetical protein